MAKEQIPRIDIDENIRKKILPLCRLKPGEIWSDPENRHRVGCFDATKKEEIKKLLSKKKAVLAIHDPPYNLKVGRNISKNLNRLPVENYISFSQQWVENTLNVLDENSHLYIWLGADQNDFFQPLPEFMIMMRGFEDVKSRSFITLRNQRGYGTQKNWMSVRQELLYYIKGNPKFYIEAEYTDIPKVLKGYYKDINGKRTENLERSHSNFIRAGNVWIDIQQVFYLMKENVPGCYAQKPLKAIERIISASSKKDDLIIDFFAHAGTTLIAAEKLERKCFTCDIDPIFCELTIRRLEHFRKTNLPGWQFQNPFPEIS